MPSNTTPKANTEGSAKVRENRIRRIAARRGYQLLKSRRRDPKAYDFGGYMLADLQSGAAVFGSDPFAYAATLDEVETFLDEE
jgi:hypothetical protein